MPVLYALWRNTRRRLGRLAERLTFETRVLKLPSCTGTILRHDTVTPV
jgi:hypothetical protein